MQRPHQPHARPQVERWSLDSDSDENDDDDSVVIQHAPSIASTARMRDDQSPRKFTYPAPAHRPPSLFISQAPRPRPLSEDRTRANAVAGPSHSTGQAQAPRAPSLFGAPRPFDSHQPVKQRAFEAIKHDNVSKGIPIAVPRDDYASTGWHRRLVPAATTSSAPPGETDDVLAAFSKLSVRDDLSKSDQEAALVELFNSTLDMNGVDVSADMPAALRCTLMPHQVQGLYWLKDREKGKKRGGILADDMGLGKTVQMIALILANKAPSEDKTTLIICPVSLMHQWQSEIKAKTDGSLRVLLHHGTNRTTSGKKLKKYDVVITSYQTAASEWPGRALKGAKGDNGEEADESVVIGKSGALFDGIKYHRIILDEAHNIKGRNTNANKACRALPTSSQTSKWCLTGTPIHNTVMDLFSLFEFLGPTVKPLHEIGEFKAKIETPLKNGRAKIAMARLQVVLRAVMLRRTKTMNIDGKPILTLPAREINIVGGPFADEHEKEFYDAVEKRMTLAMNAFLRAGSVMSNYTNILILLLRMRQACSHPSLAQMPSTDGADVDEAVTASKTADLSLKCEVCQRPLLAGVLCRNCDDKPNVADALRPSTKINRCLSILRDVQKEGNGKKKTIIFSQFVKMFDVLEPFLKKEGYRFVRYEGSMSPVERDQALEKIRNDSTITIILISIKAGSVGLNLTCCSRVILLDLWWNPQIEEQSFDRAHRVGQTDDVKIYKITIDETIEDRILTLQQKKAEVAKAALDGGELSANKLTMQDILFLFRHDGQKA